MKRIAICLMVVSLLALGGQAFAEMCAIDAVPAATLLLPYFEVDLDNQDNITTLFSVNNASAAATLAHVTFWTDWTQPTFDFDIFLTGYDVVTVNLADVFRGVLPYTADEQNDGGDTISPHGLNPSWDGSFPNCANVFPFGPEGAVVVGQNNLTRLVEGHTGGNPFGTGCMGETFGDNIARGYITIDDVSACSTVFPNETGYFVDGGLGIATNENQLWGDYFIVNRAENFALGEVLVPIEAQDGFNGTAEVPGYTYYGRYDPALTGQDNREPLGTSWGTRYINNAVFDGGTDLLVWRDSTTRDTQEFYTCGVGPSWRPLNETEAVAFDEQENAVEICFNQGGGNFSPPDPDFDPACFPLETQRVAVGEGNLTLPYEAGWLFLNLNINDVGVNFDVDFGMNGDIAQSHVTTVMSALGRFQVGFQAFVITDACQDASPLLTDPPNNIPTL